MMRFNRGTKNHIARWPDRMGGRGNLPEAQQGLWGLGVRGKHSRKGNSTVKGWEVRNDGTCRVMGRSGLPRNLEVRVGMW